MSGALKTPKWHIADPLVPIRELWHRPFTMAMVLFPYIVGVLIACIISRHFTWLYLIPVVFGFLFGAIVTRSLREGRHEDNTGVCERRKDPVGYWFGVIWWSGAYLLLLGVVIGIGYQIERKGEIPRRKQAEVTIISVSDGG